MSLVADPYPVIDPLGKLTPVVDVPFAEVRRRISALNRCDPQPPGYRYGLPLAAEFDHWAERRALVVPDEAYKPWDSGVSQTYWCRPQQGISYYEDGLWHHVGGSVNSWCSDPLTPGGNRVIRGGSCLDLAFLVQRTYRSDIDPSFAYFDVGYRVVRGVPQCP